jgi:hypothetical protein
MESNTARWQIAQTLVQSLVALLAAPTRPTHAQVQSVLDQAAAQLKALDAQPQQPPTPINVPNLMPPTPPTSS